METRRRLLFAAEHLSATQGLGGLSAREIATKAKLRNNVSVQYHFGSIPNLLRELVQFRMTELDAIRAEMIAATGQIENCGIAQCVDFLCLPHLRLAKRNGGRPYYAAFLCQYLPSAYPAGFDWMMHGEDRTLPSLNQIFDQIKKQLPPLPTEIFQRRLTNSTLLFLNVIQGLTVKDLSEERLVERSVIVQDALRQSAAVLTVPFHQ